MRYKCSLAILGFLIISCMAVPAVAYAATVTSDTASPTGTMNFSPLIYIILLLVAILLCLAIVAIVQYLKYREKKKLIGPGLFDLNLALDSFCKVTTYDYSQMETPEELLGYNQMEAPEELLGYNQIEAPEELLGYSQIEKPEELLGNYSDQRTLAVEEAISRLVEEHHYVPRHQRMTSGQREDVIPLPRIRLVPEMKHARRMNAEPVQSGSSQSGLTQAGPRQAAPRQAERMQAGPTLIEVPLELEILLRKIS